MDSVRKFPALTAAEQEMQRGEWKMGSDAPTYGRLELRNQLRLVKGPASSLVQLFGNTVTYLANIAVQHLAPAA